MINRPNIAELVTSKYGRPSSSVGVSGLDNQEARNEAYRASVDAQLKQSPEYRAEGGGFGGFFSGVYDYVTNLDPEAASGDGLFRDLGEAFSPTTMRLADKLKEPPTPETPAIATPTAGNSEIKTRPMTPTAPTAPTVPTTETGETAKRPLSESLLMAIKETMPELIKFGTKAAVNKAYEFNPTTYATSSRSRPSPRRTGIGINPIAGSGFKDGGALLGRDLYLGGGEVTGPGGPKEDLVPIWASDDEYVVSADAVTRLGDGDHAKGIASLDRINFG
jgi:hypothetical protein